MKKKSVIEMLQNADFDNSGTLSFTQFTAGSYHLNEENVQLVFSYLDINNVNHLCSNTMQQSFKRQGKNYGEEKVRKMFLDAGFDPDDKMTYAEFEDFMLPVKQSTEIHFNTD